MFKTLKTTVKLKEPRENSCIEFQVMICRHLEKSQKASNKELTV